MNVIVLASNQHSGYNCMADGRQHESRLHPSASQRRLLPQGTGIQRTLLLQSAELDP